MIFPCPILFEDDAILVIEKPAGLVVERDHQPMVNGVVDETDPTLEDYLKKRSDIEVPRGGIVHRLDRDTSGVMVVAKTAKALTDLQNQFQSHLVTKKYEALVYGKLEPERGTIDIPLVRSERDRTKFVPSKSGKAREAVTHYDVQGYPLILNHICTLLEVRLETGRTHQIRAHFAGISYPIIGDQSYHTKVSFDFSHQLGIARQFLHATELSFRHPESGEMMHFRSNLPAELGRILLDT